MQHPNAMLSSDPERPEATNRDATSFLYNVPVANRPGDIRRRIWTEWMGWFCEYGHKCTEYQHDACWGSTILRTCYDDDDKFALAVAAVRRLAMIPIELDFEARGAVPARDQPAEEDDEPEVDDDVRLDVKTSHPKLDEILQEAYQGMVRRARSGAPPGTRCTHDWVITHELMCRYHNFVVEDRQALEGADVAAAWHYFHHAGCGEREEGLRGTMFVLMDRETINHLAAAPSEQELASMARSERAKVAWQHWIKVVTTACKCTDDGDDLDEVSDDHMGRRRIRMYDFLDIFLWLQHRGICEMDVEGRGRERFPGYGEREWEFCANPNGPSDVQPWLEETTGVTGRYMDRNDSREVKKWHDAILVSRYDLQPPCTLGKDVANADTLLVLQTFNIQ
ncbi:hypothetical protein N658DRAFT_525454 [Parathielavia hyrcaniae]|uniref:Uncharacterized protein n=1 Tax=Parathielavia hyrcaniae TaxID=113614 RepID=A0AAN6PXI2_9PEZI|nr:hypothetical protein N658DRAFT_525454 [Parathielavia hyrcaniae]